MRTRRTCKLCKKRRLCGSTGYCQHCERIIALTALTDLEIFLSDETMVKAFCDSIAEYGKSIQNAMHALQGGNNAE